MINMRKMLALTGTAVLVALAGCAGEQPATQTESGTYSVTYDNVGGLIAFRTGTGKLTLKDGSEYAITADGYSLAALGYTIATATGRVYNLGTPEDFNGEYGAVGGSAVLGTGSSSFKLRNRGNDVLLDANSTETGLRAGLGGGFVTFKLGERLKGPRVAAAPPKPAPAPAPVAMLPTRHEIEFGFNKSRVNLATGRLLDTIVADWKDKPAAFEVVEHADTVGSNRYNEQLSTARAQNVRNALIARGIAANRITARGVGQNNLAVPTPDETRLRANPRVVIEIAPGTSNSGISSLADG